MSSRKKTKNVKDLDSSPIKEDPNKEGKNKIENKKVDRHFFYRFSRYIRLGGMLQRIYEKACEENLKIKRDEIVSVGKSLYQDKKSGQGELFHAAHVVKMNTINKELETLKNLFEELKNFLGHTQIVPRYANLGIGQAIDKFQEEKFDRLNLIDFRDEKRNESLEMLEELRDEYIIVLKSYSKTSNNDLNDEVQITVSCLKDMPPVKIFQHGNDGYSEKHSHTYE